jgi:hypothetical protein
VAAVVVAGGMLTVESAAAQQRRDGELLPKDQRGEVVVVGCLVRGKTIRGGETQTYVLANPRKGPVESVPDGNCTADSGAPALNIDKRKRVNMTDAALGRWVEIKGNLEKETDPNPDNLREIDVMTFRVVPVAPARPAAASAPAPKPAPAAQPAAQAPAAPAAAPAPKTLPKTASPVPLAGLAGLLLVAGGLALRSFRLRGQQ